MILSASNHVHRNRPASRLLSPQHYLLIDIRLRLLIDLQCVAVTGNQKTEHFPHHLSQAKKIEFLSSLPSRRFDPGDVTLPLLDDHDNVGILGGPLKLADGVRHYLDPLSCKRLAWVIAFPPACHLQ